MDKPAVAPGKVYLGFYCKNCGTPIPVFEDPSGGKVTLGGPGASVRATCQKCGAVREYPVAEAQRLAAHRVH